MRVSVVLPVYNTVEYLTEALESLERQDLGREEFEVVAVDDGSTDGSGELLDRWAEEHPGVRVVHQPNSGWPGMPRNRGLELSTGEYVFFMDSDDYLGPEALRRMYDFAVAHGSDVVVPRHVGVGGRWTSHQAWGDEQRVDADLRDVIVTLMPHKLLRRAFLEEHALRFPEGKVRLEDGIFFARAYLTAKRVSSLGEYDYYYLRARTGGGNISGARLDPRGYMSSVATILRTIRELCADPALADDLVLIVYRRKCLKIFRPERFSAYAPPRQREWVDAVRAVTSEFVPVALQERLSEPQRTQAALVRAGDVQGLADLARFHVDGGPPMPAPPARRLLNRLGVTPPGALAAPGVRLQVRLDRAETVPTGVRVQGSARLRGAPPAHLGYVLEIWRHGADEPPVLRLPVQASVLDDQGWQVWRVLVPAQKWARLAAGRYRATLRTRKDGLHGQVTVRGADVQASPLALPPRGKVTPYVTQGDYLGFKVTGEPAGR